MSQTPNLDQRVPAEFLRLARAHADRPLPADGELVQAIAVLARAQQDAVWNRQQLVNQLRSLLREYYPNFLPSPPVRWASPPGCPRFAGRRGIDAEAARLKTAFAAEQLRQLPLVEEAMGRQALVLLRQLDAACQAADELAEAPAQRSASTPTRRSSPASPVSARSPAPGSSPRSRRRSGTPG